MKHETLVKYKKAVAVSFVVVLLSVGVWVVFSRESKKGFEMRDDNFGYQGFENGEVPAEQEEITPNEDDNNLGDIAEQREDISNENTPAAEQGNNKTAEVSESEQEKNQQEDTQKEDVKVDFKIRDNLVSWGYEKTSDRKIDTIILHSTYNATGGDEFDLDKIIGIYKSYGVAPHYIVARDAKVYQTVKDENIAYHAGESKMPDGRTGVNNFSLGIEIINSKTQGPTGAQYDSLKKLLNYLKGKHSIKYTLGHSDIAPGRKDDPWKFEWGKVR
ncbi:MAG: N-acetylmuramoyl-L-alanine amidase [Patescibacteria group bacterium]|nr:N-acetylmuramoyl-L-alanine amidase [Patescibacteria group bacterium]